jgi:hypothetical protein
VRTSSRLRSRGIGAKVVTLRLAPHPATAPSAGGDYAVAAFAPTAAPSTSCPPGFHWEDDAGGAPIRGISACVPDATAAPVATAPVVVTPLVATPATAMTCPEPWPLWWLLVAAAAGAALGGYAKRDKKAVKKNAGRIVMNVGSRALSRLF